MYVCMYVYKLFQLYIYIYIYTDVILHTHIHVHRVNHIILDKLFQFASSQRAPLVSSRMAGTLAEDAVEDIAQECGSHA